MTAQAAIQNTKQEFNRGYKGRPLIIPPGGGKPVSYTRCTTYVGCIEDTYNLERWKLRQAAQGFGARPELGHQAKAAGGDRDKLERIVDEALAAAETDDAANRGSAVHELTEGIDRGIEIAEEQILSTLAVHLGRMPSAVEVDATLGDLAAYRDATEPLKALHIEVPTVIDTLQIAGTPDRVVTFEGERYIADLKTGRIDYGTGKIAAQLAVYARSFLYDVATGERTIHGASTNRGIVIHLRDGECVLHWIDLEAGWDYVMDAQRVRDRRKSATFKALTEPLVGKPERPSLHLAKAAETKAADRTAAQLDGFIASCKTGDELRELWAEFDGRGWTDAHTDASKARLAEIELGVTETNATPNK